MKGFIPLIFYIEMRNLSGIDPLCPLRKNLKIDL